MEGDLIFTSSTQHVFAQLERIDLLIRAQVGMARALQAADPAFQGLYITEQEVEVLLNKPLGVPNWDVQVAADNGALHASLERLSLQLAEREEESLRQGHRLRLVELARRFGISRFDINVVLMCLASELDLRYERLYAYLQDDVTKKWPSIDLALSLLCRSFNERLAARRRFAPGAPLVAHRLIEVCGEPANGGPLGLGRFLRLDPRIVDHLLTDDDSAASLPDFLVSVPVDSGFDELIAAADVKQRLQAICDAMRVDHSLPIFLFTSSDTHTKEHAAKAMCHEIGIGLLCVDGRRIATNDETELRERVAIVAREARLQGSAVYWQAADDVLTADLLCSIGGLLGATNQPPVPMFLEARGPLFSSAVCSGTRVIEVEFPLPDYDQRVALWQRTLAGAASVDAEDIHALAATFRLSASQIEAAVNTASNHAYWRNPQEVRVQMDELRRACRLHSNQGLRQLAQKIKPRYQWDNIVLPADRLMHLREILNAIKYRPVVYKRWGFDRKLSLGKGTNILFAGPSGTGKTMVAEIFANDLGVDLYKIDLSSVVSKFIGETEKNLAKIFDEAQTSNAILFFDEADALFGKRSTVKDAHDRYANIETSYLLQKMEEYEGVVMLATNLRNNMDDAFVRRITYIVAFPIPDEADRLRIWQGIWPMETPRDRDLDLEFMARRFNLAGGNIKNIGLAAAFLAAANGQNVTMEHLMRATKRELQKIGKVCTKNDFGPYHALVERELS